MVRAWFVGACVSLTVGMAQAQILIGQTAGFTGPVAAGVKDSSDGAKLYFDDVNAKGGVAGQKIELIAMDDKFDPKLSAENGRILVEDRKVLALFLSRGTEHSQALFPLVEKTGVALVAPSSGAAVMHTPVQKTVFNVRATYGQEAAKLTEFLTNLGPSRTAIVYPDNTFGNDSLEGALAGFAKSGYKPVAVMPTDLLKPDIDGIVDTLVKAKVQSVVWIGTGVVVTAGIKALRKANSIAQVATLSNNASSGFIKGLGEDARGVILSQIFPDPRTVDYPMVNEANKLAKAKGIELSPAMLEGYASAKVLVEGLRRAGAQPSRASLVKALGSLNAYDLGGLVIDYSSTDHTGLSYVDHAMIDGNGRFRR